MDARIAEIKIALEHDTMSSGEEIAHICRDLLGADACDASAILPEVWMISALRLEGPSQYGVFFLDPAELIGKLASLVEVDSCHVFFINNRSNGCRTDSAEQWTIRELIDRSWLSVRVYDYALFFTRDETIYPKILSEYRSASVTYSLPDEINLPF
jgi:hypothetical protein